MSQVKLLVQPNQTSKQESARGISQNTEIPGNGADAAEDFEMGGGVLEEEESSEMDGAESSSHGKAVL